jgi:AbrB family looped-hinge helix DNA binding protein
MPHVIIGPKHQITIPKQIFDALEFKAGDILEMMVHMGKVIIIPKQITEKVPAPKLSKKEQELLISAKSKIKAINVDIADSKGLSENEAEVAVQVGIIDPEQKWWWLEEWQKGERIAEEEIETGKISESFKSADELIKHLES